MQPWSRNVPRRSEQLLERTYWELSGKRSCCAGRWNFGRRHDWLWKHLLGETKCKKGEYKTWTWGLAPTSWKSWLMWLWDCIYCLWQLQWLGKSPMAGKRLTLHLSFKRWERKLGNCLLIRSISVTGKSGIVWQVTSNQRSTQGVGTEIHVIQ